MKIYLGIFLIIQTLSGVSFAEEEYEDFDSIVKSLSSSRSQAEALPGEDPFDNVKMHFGVGFVNTYLTVVSNQGPVSGFHQGFQAAFGIDLFTPKWIAEGAVRSFGESEIEKNLASLHEFDLKILYNIYPERGIAPYMGFGVAARYLEIKSTTSKSTTVNGKTGPTTQTVQGYDDAVKYSTPASILILGAKLRLTDNLNFGLEGSYRTPMISETAEKSALDMSVRLNTTF